MSLPRRLRYYSWRLFYHIYGNKLEKRWTIFGACSHRSTAAPGFQCIGHTLLRCSPPCVIRRSAKLSCASLHALASPSAARRPSDRHVTILSAFYLDRMNRIDHRAMCDT